MGRKSNPAYNYIPSVQIQRRIFPLHGLIISSTAGISLRNLWTTQWYTYFISDARIEPFAINQQCSAVCWAKLSVVLQECSLNGLLKKIAKRCCCQCFAMTLSGHQIFWKDIYCDFFFHKSTIHVACTFKNSWFKHSHNVYDFKHFDKFKLNLCKIWKY